MTAYGSPSRLITIDKHTEKIAYPNIILQGRSRDNVIGKISNYDNYNLSLVGVGIDEVSFDVPKYVNGVKNNHWDSLVDLKIIELQKYGRFQIKVGYTDEAKTTKSVIGQSLEVELAQIPLREFHINDEEDMDMVKTEYSEHKYKDGKFIPVYFYNEDNPKRSLLHMVLADKAPHWSIGHVPTYVSMSEDAEAELASEFMRTYTEDGTSIYDFLTGTVAKETNVVFVFDTINRIINCYSLIDCYITNGENRVLVESGIGEDTLVFATKRNIVNQVSIDSNEDQVKNCFFVEGGDDTINGMLAAINMNGTRYIWKFAPFQLADMSEELRTKLTEYQNTISDQSVKDEYYGENGIFTRLCNAYQELYQKESTMMPGLVNVDPQTAEVHYNKIVEGLQSTTVYVSNINDYSSDYFTGATRNIEAFAEVLTDSRYDVEVIKDTVTYTHTEGSSVGTWKGKIKVTRNTDDTNTYPIDIENSDYITIYIGDGSTVDGQYEFVKQKLMKALTKSDMQNLDFGIEDDVEEIKEYFDQFALHRLDSFYDAYNECVNILQQYGVNTDSEIQAELLPKYQKVLTAITEVRTKRQEEVEAIESQIETLKGLQVGFSDKYNLDLRKRLGEELYEEFCSYRREDTYSNSNYTSDNKETVAEQLEMAKELMDVADAELSKACMLQRTVSTSLSNLLVLPEFEHLYDSFALFNYIRIQTDDEVLKLRLIGIDFSGDSIQDINVTFSEQVESVDRKTSDIESILNSAQSMATSFPATVRQAKQGESANKEFVDIHANGLNATKAMITNNDNNEVTITNIGLLAKRMDDEGYYGKKQLRISGNGMYLTDDAWDNLRMAVGEIIYINPITGVQEQAYGLIADTLIGNLIAGKQMHIGNEDGSVLITGNGIELDGGAITWKTPLPSSSVDGLDNYLEQLDGRIQTYSQTEDPSTEWKTMDEKNQHIGDIWLNPSDGLTKQWDGTKWIEITDSALKELAESKAQIFTYTPTTPYYVGDLWVQGADGDILNCIQSKLSGSYDSSHWEISSKYTDDTTAKEALKQAQQGIKDAAEGISLANKAQSTANTANTNATNAEKNAKAYADTKDASLSSTLTTAYQSYTNTKVATLDEKVSDYLGWDGKTIIDDKYVISPYLGGGYLNITSTDGSGKRVIIDPNNLTKNNYIFQVHNGKEISVGIKADGTTNINAHIHAKSLTLGDSVSISTSNISGLSTVATSGKYSDLSGNPDLSVYATNDSLSSYVTNTSLSSQLKSYATTGELSAYLKTNDLNTKLGELDVAYRGDVTTTQETLANGIIKTTSKYIGSDGKTYTTTTYSATDSDYVLLSRDSSWGSENSLVKISKDGLLEANNAIISGTIYATDGEFTGDIKSGSTITCGSKFKVDVDGKLTCSDINATGGTFSGDITSDATISGGTISGANITSTYNGSSTTIYNGSINTNDLTTTGIVFSNNNNDMYFDFTGSVLEISNYGISTTETIECGKCYSTACVLGESACRPVENGGANCGLTGYRWSNVYYKTSGICDSDRNLKNSISTLSENFENFYSKIIPVSYKFNDGTSGRTHIGFISQEIESAIEEVGLTAYDFAGFCKDEKTEIVVDENGNEIEVPVLDEKGNKQYLYSLRYEEFIALNTHMIQKTRKENEELKQTIEYQKAEIDTLKEQVSFLMQQYNTQEQN